MSSGTMRNPENRLGFGIVIVEPDADEVDLKHLLQEVLRWATIRGITHMEGALP